MDLTDYKQKDFERLIQRFMVTDANWMQRFIRYVGAFSILENDLIEVVETAIYNCANKQDSYKSKRLGAKTDPKSNTWKYINRFRAIMTETKEMVEVIHNRPWEIETKKPEQIKLFGEIK